MINTIKNHIEKRNSFIDVRRINFNTESYKPKANKFKRVGLFSLVVFCLVTPFTNWLLIPTFKVLSKFPMWLYK